MTSLYSTYYCLFQNQVNLGSKEDPKPKSKADKGQRNGHRMPDKILNHSPPLDLLSLSSKPLFSKFSYSNPDKRFLMKVSLYLGGRDLYPYSLTATSRMDSIQRTV